MTQPHEGILKSSDEIRPRAWLAGDHQLLDENTRDEVAQETDQNWHVVPWGPKSTVRWDASKTHEKLRKHVPYHTLDATVMIVPEGYFEYHMNETATFGQGMRRGESAMVRGDLYTDIGEHAFNSVTAQEVAHPFVEDAYPEPLALSRNGDIKQKHARTEHDAINDGPDDKFAGRSGWLTSTAYELGMADYNLHDDSPMESFMSYNIDEPSWIDTIAYQKLLESHFEYSTLFES